MLKVVSYSLLLILGMALSQLIVLLPTDSEQIWRRAIQFFSMLCLAFIMIRVGQEFYLDKNNPKKYLKDYFVAATAAAFPWAFCALYFVFILRPENSPLHWTLIKEASILSRFAAPTSAGVLFSMLIAAGLAGTWTYRRARILAIFDDLDTVLLMIPLKMMIVGLKWQMGFHILVMVTLLYLAWRYLNTFPIPTGWRATLVFAGMITVVSESIYLFSKVIDDTVPVHIEVLLPAFVLGVLAIPPDHEKETTGDKWAMTAIVSFFMVLVGLNLPSLKSIGISYDSSASIAIHVLLVTFIINLGKMFPLFCYKKEAHWKERLAVCVGMFPRGEVGAGVLMLSLSYGIGGKMLAVAVFTLVLNLVLSGVFIWIAKLLIKSAPAR